MGIPSTGRLSLHNRNYVVMASEGGSVTTGMAEKAPLLCRAAAIRADGGKSAALLFFLRIWGVRKRLQNPACAARCVEQWRQSGRRRNRAGFGGSLLIAAALLFATWRTERGEGKCAAAPEACEAARPGKGRDGMKEKGYNSSDICVCCGAPVPEGTMICQNCAARRNQEAKQPQQRQVLKRWKERCSRRRENRKEKND